jgi:hypothetical protein
LSELKLVLKWSSIETSGGGANGGINSDNFGLLDSTVAIYIKLQQIILHPKIDFPKQFTEEATNNRKTT